jgi:hypothetical protein
MTQATNIRSRSRRPLLISLAIVALLAIVLVSSSGVYTDVLWFDQLGYLSVFTTQITAQVNVFIVAALFAALVIWGNIFVAWRFRPIYVTSNEFFGRDLGEYRNLLEKLRRRLLFVIPVVIEKDDEIPKNNICKKCNKSFADRICRWRHEKKCNDNNQLIKKELLEIKEKDELRELEIKKKEEIREKEMEKKYRLKVQNNKK